MKRNERNTLNSLKRGVNELTVYVEIPVSFSREARQAIHELLTIEKGLYAVRICPWSMTRKDDVILYHRPIFSRHEQENMDIDTIMGILPYSDYTWNGYQRKTIEKEA